MSFLKKHKICLLLALDTFFLVLLANPINTKARNALTFRTIEEIDTEDPVWARGEDDAKTVLTDGPVVRLFKCPPFCLRFQTSCGVRKTKPPLTCLESLDQTQHYRSFFSEAMLIIQL